MVYNELLMQFHPTSSASRVIRPKVAETTALGAAYAAGLAVGSGRRSTTSGPMGEGQGVEAGARREVREKEYRFWKKAVTRPSTGSRHEERVPVPA